MVKNKIQCNVKSGHLEVDMSREMATNVLYALKGFYACAKLTIPDEPTRKFRGSQFIAEAFLEKPDIFTKICNDEFIESEGKIPGYEMFLIRVIEKIQDYSKK